MKFTIGKRVVHWDEDMVSAAMAEVEPEEPRNHAVHINSAWYPPKQVIAVLTGWDRMSYSTQEATRVLSRLGFRCSRVVDPEITPEERWEYNFTDWADADKVVADRLDMMGEEGWELVSVLALTPTLFRYYWKRPASRESQIRRLRRAI